jgi:hypothetical protein
MRVEENGRDEIEDEFCCRKAVTRLCGQRVLTEPKEQVGGGALLKMRRMALGRSHWWLSGGG